MPNDNQTLFGAEEPLFEEAVVPGQPQGPKIPVDAEAAAKPIRKPFSPWLLGGLIGGVLLLVIGVGLLARLMVTPPAVQIEPSPSPQLSAEEDALQKRLNELKIVLNEADPTRNQEPFPPVDLELSLEETR